VIERFAAAGVRLVCPQCRHGLQSADDWLACGGCGRKFPVVAGIPDLRLFPDRFLSQEADRAKGLKALERAGGRGFEAALHAYWEMTPELAPKLARGHIRRQLAETSVGGELLNELARCGVTGSPLLDLGCGSGGLLAAVAKRGPAIVGVDAAFRWLLIGRERLRQMDREPLLVAANAEALPFEAGSFPAVCANDLLEHLADPTPAVAEIARLLAPAGAAYIATNNRYSLLPEPHVRLPGVGWLPRTLQPRYVRLVRRHAYDKVRLLGVGELRSLLRDAGLDAGILSAPLFSRHFEGMERRLALLVNQAPWPVSVAPRFAAIARRTESVG
jgi:SAM-dependent methyltransferase